MGVVSVIGEDSGDDEVLGFGLAVVKTDGVGVVEGVGIEVIIGDGVGVSV